MEDIHFYYYYWLYIILYLSLVNKLSKYMKSNKMVHYKVCLLSWLKLVHGAWLLTTLVIYGYVNPVKQIQLYATIWVTKMWAIIMCIVINDLINMSGVYLSHVNGHLFTITRQLTCCLATFIVIITNRRPSVQSKS